MATAMEGQAALSAPATVATGGLLRFTTAGSVDDGKSTLIGRLLYDTQSAYEDQVDAVRRSRINRSSGPIDFSLLTDGLRAEREQGITIDVAYRYFSTPRRKFIIADTPGHVEYTRNMATGASTADAAIVLIDATRGVLPQSRRHAYIAKLLGIQHVIFAVNKMDIAGYNESVFRRSGAEIEVLARQLELADASIIPLSALEGDNVVRPGGRMPWFDGPSLLECLESVPLASAVENAPLRFPVQYVIRPNADFRGFAGHIAAGTVAKGDRVLALPSRRTTRVRSIVSFDGELERASAGDAIVVTLEDEIDLSRGDLIVSEGAAPQSSRRISASLVWMQDEQLDPGRLYHVKHTTRTARARVARIQGRLDVDTLAFQPAASLALNDIATVELETSAPLLFDTYRENRTTGSFILIDPISNATVAAGMIERAADVGDEREHATGPVSAEERARRFGHAPAAVWIEGAEKVAACVERTLFEQGWITHRVTTAKLSLPQLTAVADALRSLGAIAVFSGGPKNNGREAITDIFGVGAFFSVAGDGSDAERAAVLISKLSAWRERSLSPADEGGCRD